MQQKFYTLSEVLGFFGSLNTRVVFLWQIATCFLKPTMSSNVSPHGVHSIWKPISTSYKLSVASISLLFASLRVDELVISIICKILKNMIKHSFLTTHITTTIALGCAYRFEQHTTTIVDLSHLPLFGWTGNIYQRLVF